MASELRLGRLIVDETNVVGQADRAGRDIDGDGSIGTFAILPSALAGAHGILCEGGQGVLEVDGPAHDLAIIFESMVVAEDVRKVDLPVRAIGIDVAYGAFVAAAVVMNLDPGNAVLAQDGSEA